jgi:hypothetical protein
VTFLDSQFNKFQQCVNEVKVLPEQEIVNLDLLKEQLHAKNLFDYYPPYDATSIKE